ncbi:MAG: hypothetical protein AVDCRST_MAG65-631, partial [uncultured Solirubrobacteraceae bacterium]
EHRSGLLRQAAALRDRQGRRGPHHGGDRPRPRRRGARTPHADLRGLRAGPRHIGVRRRQPAARRGAGRAVGIAVGDQRRHRRGARGLAWPPARLDRPGAHAGPIAGLPVLRRRRPRGAGADHHREGLRPRRGVRQRRGALRPGDRRRSRVRAWRRHAGDARHLRTDRPGGDRAPPGGEDRRAARRPRADRLPGRDAARGDAGQRDPRGRDGRRARGRLRARRGHRQRRAPTAALPPRGTQRALLPRRRVRRPCALGAGRRPARPRPGPRPAGADRPPPLARAGAGDDAPVPRGPAVRGRPQAAQPRADRRVL